MASTPAFRAVCAAVVAALAVPLGVTAPSSADTEVEGRYLVLFDGDTHVTATARALRGDGMGVPRTFRHALKGAVVVTTPRQAAALAHSPGVLAVEPDRPVRAADAWGLDRMDQRRLPLSGTFTAPGTGKGVDVYVVDTGVRRDHDDFGDRVVDGWSAFDDGLEFCGAHGTHVAGVAAGEAYGAAKRATVIPVRVLKCDGSGLMSDVVAGLDWVTAHHDTGDPAVVNLSLAGRASTVADAALVAAVADGLTATVAAGNKSVDACTTSPGRARAALTVAASDSSDREAEFSNGGPCVDLYAPGVDVTSDWPTSASSVAPMSGTSVASAHVAGAVAVLLGLAPTLPPAEVSARLLYDTTSGVLRGLAAGSPDRLLFLGPTTLSPVPRVPTRATDVRARPRSRSAVVLWTRGVPRGTPITRQVVTVHRGGELVRSVRVGADSTRVRVWRLRPGSAYRFRVVERSRLGASRPSAYSNRVVVRR